MLASVVNPLDALIADSTARATRDPDYVGGVLHCQAIETFLAQVCGRPLKSVMWLPPGSPSSWDRHTGVIHLERPTIAGRSAPETADLAALQALHETLHVFYDDGGGFTYGRATQRSVGLQRDCYIAIYNMLEDARCERLGKAETGLAPHLDRFRDAAFPAQLAKPATKQAEFFPPFPIGCVEFRFPSISHPTCRRSWTPPNRTSTPLFAGRASIRAQQQSRSPTDSCVRVWLGADDSGVPHRITSRDLKRDSTTPRGCETPRGC